MDKTFDITKFREMFLACTDGGPYPNETIISMSLLCMPMQWLKDGVRMATPHMWGMQACEGAYKR